MSWYALRFQKAARAIVRQCLNRRLEGTPEDKRVLRRLGNLANLDGEMDEALHFLRRAAEVGDDVTFSGAAWKQQLKSVRV